jgi:multiple sugar transport system permease protein
MRPRLNVLRENLTAYLFVSPAMLLILIFGVLPVGFAFYVSLYRWRRFPDEYRGLDNYVRSLGDLAFVLFFWLAVCLIGYGLYWIAKSLRARGWIALPAAAISAAALAALTQWIGVLLPVVLDVPQRIRGRERETGLFLSEFFASFRALEVLAAHAIMLPLIVAALIVTAFTVWIGRRAPTVQTATPPLNLGRIWATLTAACSAIVAGGLLMQLTLSEIEIAAAAARESGESLPIWSLIVLISAGVGVLGASYALWTRATRPEGDRAFAWRVGAAAMLMIGGYILATQLPFALTNADPAMLNGYGITIMFALGTIPPQLAIGLGLAYLLFQKIKGKALFRMLYFLPYIMPFAATSIVFGILFSQRPESPVNRLLTAVGIPVQKWLLEPTGIFELLFGANTPDALAGPGLALVVIMLYTVWTYIGYATVVFLAGLGNISPELYEAARIDGAGEWAIFRYITLPLLSPTTYFLSLISVIGTFQAFTQIWIMRTPAAGNSVDTVGVYIFETVRSTDPNMGYGSALSLVLFVVIVGLTIVQNRYASRRIVYG